MTTADTTPVWRACCAAAREHGVAPALHRLHRGVLPGLLPFGPGGTAVLPHDLAGDTVRVWLDGSVVGRGRERTRPGRHDAPGGPLVTYVHPVDAADDPDDDTDGLRRDWTCGIAAIRLGLSEALLDRCVRHLAARTGPDGALLLHPVLKDALAAARIDQLEARSVLDGDGPAPPPHLLARVHDCLGAADRTLLRALGASGFTTDGAGSIARASELLADAYARPRGTER